ncbi:DUF4339 domain-containing protein [Pelodictyon phaeoclathratiforme]|jgi:hypothetical protein|uniref:GYF domain-containing protein n=1 Tax=Pelodictyon phaeoclathratiforme (strain DSM 5477 / BU-1) TaxID=324925 RepID=B4SFJ3_PELPB|nr:DUF4339 domain-containing protein [Pelodictyon phaeoclathratiforme]ACF43248.1 conserved hypothetical protein [Pelodictyon phaeoclathratiforme BU-1]MBV5290034.1 DUF4339 domain-containing protein [Pelodictyon phaeoclathratiforme]
MTATEQSSPNDKLWFYESGGERKGGVSEDEIINIIKSGTLSQGSVVWKKGFADWMKIENTELRSHLDESMPPPLTGEYVKNTVIWVLAFGPILGYMLEYFVAGSVYSDSQYHSYLVERAVSKGEFWYITLILNIALATWDEMQLKKAGTNTNRFHGWVWLVPVYLYQRAKALKHNQAYFIVWIVCFVLILAGT